MPKASQLLISEEKQTSPSSSEPGSVLRVFKKEIDSESLVAAFTLNVTVHNPDRLRKRLRVKTQDLSAKGAKCNSLGQRPR